MSSDLEFELGLKTGAFEQARDKTIAGAGEMASQITKKFELKDLGRTLATALGINLESIAENVARLFTGVTKQTEEFSKRAIELTDQTTAAIIKNFDDRNTASEKLKQNIIEQGKAEAEIAGIRAAQAERYALAQEAASTFGADAAGYAKYAQQTDAESLRIIELVAKINQLNLEIQKTTNAQKQKQLDREKELHDFNFQNAELFRKIFNDQVKLLDAEYDKRHLQGAEAREALILQAKLISGQISPAESVRLNILKLQTKQLEINADIDQALLIPAKQRTVEQQQHLTSLFSQNDVVTRQIALQTTLLGTSKSITAEDQKQLDLAKEKAAEQKKEADALASFAGNFKSTGREDADLSPRELDAKITALQKDIDARKAAALFESSNIGNPMDGFGGGNYDPFLRIQQQNLVGAQAEIDLRAQVQQLASILGADRTATQLGLTDERVQSILGTIDQNKQQTDLLQSINTQLKSGIATVQKS